jgi:hypothetical protein
MQWINGSKWQGVGSGVPTPSTRNRQTLDRFLMPLLDLGDYKSARVSSNQVLTKERGLDLVPLGLDDENSMDSTSVQCRWRSTIAAVKQWSFPSLRAPRESVPLRVRLHAVNLGSWASYRCLRQGPLTMRIVDRLWLRRFGERWPGLDIQTDPNRWDQPNIVFSVTSIQACGIISIFRITTWKR